MLRYADDITWMLAERIERGALKPSAPFQIFVPTKRRPLLFEIRRFAEAIFSLGIFFELKFPCGNSLEKKTASENNYTN